MPGLEQLKQFTSDILNIGDEVKIRAARGEKPVTVPVPKDLVVEDDSQDFMYGMPELSKEEEEQALALAAEKEREANDFGDITGESSESDNIVSVEENNKAIDMSDLDAGSLGDIDDMDFSDFMDEQPEEEVEEEPEPISIADQSLDSLLTLNNPVNADSSSSSESGDADLDDDPFGFGDFENYQATHVKPKTEEPKVEKKFNPHNLTVAPSIEDFENDLMKQAQNSAEVDALEDLDADGFDLGDDSDLSELGSFDPLENAADNLGSGDFGMESLPSFPDDSELTVGGDFSQDMDSDGPVSGDASLGDISLPEFPSGDDWPSLDDGNEVDMTAGTSLEEKPDADGYGTMEAGLGGDDGFKLDDLPEDIFNDGQMTSDSGSDGAGDNIFGDMSGSKDSMDANIDSIFDGIGNDGQNDTVVAEDKGTSGAEALTGSEDAPEVEEPMMDLSAALGDMEGMDFSEAGAVVSGNDSDGFGMDLSDSDFEIEGFTTPGEEAPKKPSKAPGLSTPDFSEAEEDENNKPKNTFTEAEYRLFRKNLSEYPLNLRLAIENMVVSNEFTDDTIFEVLEKVLRKVPARQIASHLDKQLDIHVDVPRDFERRTAEEYELYKQSLEYRLKNQILPFAIVSAIAAILIFCIGYLSWNFVWKPLRAEHFYKQGYAQIQENLYPQSEESFNMAVRSKAKKNWFYKYAESYRDHHQYERAENTYKAAIRLFDHDKKAGLDWALMEQEDLYAYQKSEEILKRQVLDYHINDPDAILQLGDLYLEWGDEEDPSKYAAAKEQYDFLVNMKAGKKDMYRYQSREMRYYVHVDDLEKVLQYKAMFYPDNTKDLSSRDLTELSGYLFDKRYGDLRPSEEHLRSEISDVKDLLERAVRKDQSNPTALYNVGRYSIETNSDKNAEAALKASVDAFKNKSSRTKKETRTFVDAYRLLGEQYKDQMEYILAQQTYNDGINLFEKENIAGSLTGTEEVGKLYADLGDINYYINGDMEAALDNYKQSIDNKNDTAPVRYKIGYIDYVNRLYDDAWENFVNGNEQSNGKDVHTLLALANTLAMNDDYYSAQGYYQDLIDILKNDLARYDVVNPQGRSDHKDLVDTYMKATNNLGVALSRITKLNGDNDANGEAIVNFAESSRAWDTLTRNQETMVRVDTKNLASQNSTYLANPNYGYEPTIYTDIPKSMYGEEILKSR